ncbi:hypothetical protein GX48_04044 [Paracoccidioides brasiliensis]|nr:hypothetical protein GX48_04044 [Paracoccidioides brasiliensis]
MGGRTDEALQCFTYISDNVPFWVARVTDLAAHTKAKHAEFSAEYARLTSSSDGEAPKPRRRKNSSIHTIRLDNMQPFVDFVPYTEEKEKETEIEKDMQKEKGNKQNTKEDYMDPVTLLKMSKHYTFDGNQRKRNFDTSKSVGTDRIVRPRHLVVVHYDSETQTSLEKLVRDIGGARNNIRKGRMSQMMKTGFGLKFYDPAKGKSGISRKFLDPSMKYSSMPSKESAFDVVDKQLEMAQSLCELAAHQFLRCGDCEMELEKTKSQFSTVLTLTKAEMERLEKETEMDEEDSLEEEAEESRLEDTIVASTPMNAAKDVEKPSPGIIATIEVDDGSSISSVSIDITAFRSNRRGK